MGSTPTRPATFKTSTTNHTMIGLLSRLRAFWTETLTEVFVKATWPSPKELVDSTLVVIAAVAIMGTVGFLCDFSLSNFVQFATQLVR